MIFVFPLSGWEHGRKLETDLEVHIYELRPMEG